MKKEETLELLSKYAKENDKLSEELNKIKRTILNETTTFCDTCPNREHCPENECVIYRLEKLGSDENNHR